MLKVVNKGLLEKCCIYEQEAISLRLTVTNIKEWLDCQRVIVERVLDDLRDVRSFLNLQILCKNLSRTLRIV